MKRRKMVSLLLAAAMTAGVLNGCGGSGETSGITDAKSTEAAVAESGGKEKGESTIVMEITNDPSSLQPSTINQQAFMEQRMNYYERLFEWDYNGEVSPLLVKDYEWVDELHLKITLYDNIATHTGKNLTTEDVKFSLEYAKNSAEFARHTTNIDYDHIEITDDYTMIIPILQQNVLFWNDITRIDIVSKADFEESKDQMITTPIGTGPYKVTGYTPGVEVVLEKNEDYWNAGQTEIQQRNVDRIIYKFIPEEAQRTISLESGDVDFVYDPPLTELEGLMNSSDYDVLEVKTSSTPSLYFNSSDGSVCSNKELRQAISCAIDNTAIVAAVYKGFAHPACSVVTPNNPEWNDDLETSDPYAFDLEKAKSYLAEAGFEPGQLKLRLATDDVSTHKAAAEIIQAYLQQIGIEVEISIFDAGSYNTLLTQKDTWDMQINEYTTKGSILFFFGNQVNRNKNIRGFWDDDEFQNILAEALKDGDDEKVSKLVSIFMENIPIYPLMNKTNYYVYRKGIENVRTKDDYIVFPGDVTYTEEASSWLYN
ncbi:peptide/nickel transport system substrate-binding protein [Hungatella effluvii]|uniref:Peptide/nickel transport system substrate-binding protein n=1 Tax=Hungatella effluvii TaxID=1096246 RepID=A0A2V3YHD3_9FIRM|nr:ABC transporter substrate-binding protein [Hungatella effluvii]PXX57040.1 peptide/nickel transport system substrate-binding protein [Hungatella effluvii]